MEADLGPVIIKLEPSPEVNPFGVIEELKALFKQNFPEWNFESSEGLSDLEAIIANKLFKAYQDILNDTVNLYSREKEDDFSELVDGLTPDASLEVESMETGPVKMEIMEEAPEMEEDDADSEDSDMAEIIKEYEEMESGKKPPPTESKVSLERKKEIIALWKAHPKWTVKTLKKHGAKELNAKSTLYRWKRQVERSHTKLDMYKVINDHVYAKLLEAKNAGRIVHPKDLSEWALARLSEFPNGHELKFSAGRAWRQRFRTRYGLPCVDKKGQGYSLKATATDTISDAANPPSSSAEENNTVGNVEDNSS